MTHTYYLWHWATPGIGGPADAIYDELIAGRMHPAIKAFDPAKLIKDLECLRNYGLNDGEECQWEIVTDGSSSNACFVVLLLSDPVDGEDRLIERFSFMEDHWHHFAGYDETLHRLLGPVPRPNTFKTGQKVQTTEVKPDEVGELLLTLQRDEENAFAILESDLGFVQCLIKREWGVRYVLEWQDRYDSPSEANGWRLYDQWCAQDAVRLAALPPNAKQDTDTTPDLVEFDTVLKLFQTFAARQPIPDRNWRLVKL